MATHLSATHLRQILTYDVDTGLFRWNVSRGKVRAGQLAGKTGCNTSGYKEIMIDYRMYRSHRLAWLYVTGEWPALQIDHINGDRTDNRFCNLRLATHSENQANMKRKRTNGSGFKGVCRDKGQWRAKITVDRKIFDLGRFGTPEEAHQAYVAAAAAHRGIFARAG